MTAVSTPSIRPVRAAGGQFIADDREAAGARLVARAGDHPLLAAAANIEADEIRVSRDHVLRRRIGDARFLQVDERLEQRECGRILPQIGPKRDFRRLLAQKPVAADDDANLAGPPRRLRDEPCRGPPLLAVIASDIRGGGLGPKLQPGIAKVGTPRALSVAIASLTRG